MLYTWQAGDCSAQDPYNGDFDAAMKGIKAKALVLPGKTDLYFRKSDKQPIATQSEAKCNRLICCTGLPYWFSEAETADRRKVVAETNVSQPPKILRMRLLTCDLELASASPSQVFGATGLEVCSS